MLKQIVPREVAVKEAFADDPAAVLFPGERAAVATAIARRRIEFATARACARAALARLGEPPAPILRGPRGAPQWPIGVTGSITHCDGYRAAAVARTRDTLALGLDAEPNKPLPDGVLKTIALTEERDDLSELAAAEPGVCWDRLLFCVKESVYKAWFPMTGRWLDFESARITIDPVNRTFRARLLVPGPLVDGVPLSVMRGRWLTARGLLVTALVVAAWPADVSRRDMVATGVAGNETMSGLRQVRRSCRGGKYLPYGARPVGIQFEFGRITERHFFEAHAVHPCCPWDMQVPVDDSCRVVPQMPVGRPFRSAPLGEFGVPQCQSGLARQREVTDQHG